MLYTVFRNRNMGAMCFVLRVVSLLGVQRGACEFFLCR